MVLIPFGPDKIRVCPPATEAFEALAAVMLRHQYVIRTADTDSYNCRTITAGTGKSLHSYGIALDVNWTTNPFNKHGGNRLVRFSDKATQDLRARDVRFGLADTDMTEDMLADVEKITTKSGIRCSSGAGAGRIARTVCTSSSTCRRTSSRKASTPRQSKGSTCRMRTLPASRLRRRCGRRAVPGPAVPHTVIARDGLRLRSGPSSTADVAKVIAHGMRLNVIGREGDWALVDLQGDGKADGFMSQRVPPSGRARRRPLAARRAARGRRRRRHGARHRRHGREDVPCDTDREIAVNMPFVLGGSAVAIARRQTDDPDGPRYDSRRDRGLRPDRRR